MNIYTQIFMLGIYIGILLYIQLQNFIDYIKEKKLEKFLGENKLLQKYYEYKKYNRWTKQWK